MMKMLKKGCYATSCSRNLLLTVGELLGKSTGPFASRCFTVFYECILWQGRSFYWQSIKTYWWHCPQNRPIPLKPDTDCHTHLHCWDWHHHRLLDQLCCHRHTWRHRVENCWDRIPECIYIHSCHHFRSGGWNYKLCTERHLLCTLPVRYNRWCWCRLKTLGTPLYTGRHPMQSKWSHFGILCTSGMWNTCCIQLS